MAIHIGQSAKDQAAINIGSQGIQKVYVGDKLVWPSNPWGYIGFGLLYNFPTVIDARNITAEGWSIPTDAQLAARAIFLDASANPALYGVISEIVGGAVKENSLFGWLGTNVGASNSSKLNLRGSGYRLEDGTFDAFRLRHFEWTKTGDGTYGIYYQAQVNDIFYVRTDSLYSRGKSLRPVKDSTALVHGEAGLYTGNDGRVYRTICINDKEYLADNLAETKFRNGDNIPYVETNAAWAALTTPGYCYPNGNILNV